MRNAILTSDPLSEVAAIEARSPLVQGRNHGAIDRFPPTRYLAFVEGHQLVIKKHLQSRQHFVVAVDLF